PDRPSEMAGAAVERRRAVALVDGRPGEVPAAVRVSLRLAVVEHRPLVLAVGAVDRRLAGGRRADRHERDEDDDAHERHQDQVADRPAAHVTFPINFTPYAVHRARPLPTFATRRMSN